MAHLRGALLVATLSAARAQQWEPEPEPAPKGSAGGSSWQQREPEPEPLWQPYAWAPEPEPEPAFGAPPPPPAGDVSQPPPPPASESSQPASPGNCPGEVVDGRCSIDPARLQCLSTPPPLDPCPYAHDGDCDAVDGLILSAPCPEGSDWLDCDACGSGIRMGSNEDGVCDTPGGGSFWESCDAGSDFIDCNPDVAQDCGWNRLCSSYDTPSRCEAQAFRGCDWDHDSHHHHGGHYSSYSSSGRRRRRSWHSSRRRSHSSRRRSSSWGRRALEAFGLEEDNEPPGSSRRVLTAGHCEYDIDDDQTRCPYMLDGQCDEPPPAGTGICQRYTDIADCRHAYGLAGSLGLLAEKQPAALIVGGLSALSLVAVIAVVVGRRAGRSRGGEHAALAAEEPADSAAADSSAGEEEEDEDQSVAERVKLTGSV